MGRHGSKKWIRDWRGRLKRSTDRTQKDWQGALGAARSRDRILNRGMRRRWYSSGRKAPDTCPQCKFLNKNRPIRRWSVTRNLGVIVAINPHDHPTYKALDRQHGWRVRHHDLGPVNAKREKGAIEAMKAYCERSGTYRNWQYLTKHRWRLQITEMVYEERDTRGKGIIRAEPEYGPDITCDPCKRKDDVSWRLWHSGGERRHWTRGRGFTIARRLEEQFRRANVRNLMQRARYNEDLYEHIPTRITKGWLD